MVICKSFTHDFNLCYCFSIFVKKYNTTLRHLFNYWYFTMELVYHSYKSRNFYFPREILPISVVTSGLINFLISCIIIIIFLICSGIGFSINILFLPLMLFAQFIISLAIILVTSSINVYIRDAEYIINFFIQMLFYATPILYSLDMFPNYIQNLLLINPLVTIINGYRNIFYYQTIPPIKSSLIIVGVGLIALYISYKIFKKLEKGFAEEL